MKYTLLYLKVKEFHYLMEFIKWHIKYKKYYLEIKYFQMIKQKFDKALTLLTDKMNKVMN